MGAVRIWAAGLGAAALAAGLAACASQGPRPSGTEGLFRTPAAGVGGLAPGPQAGWYVNAAPRYVRMGMAQVAPERRGWLSRLLGRGKAPDGAMTATIADTAGLPLPSIVTVTNVRTGSSTRVRVEERAALGQTLIALSPQAARAVGAVDGEPLLVRVRYAEPAIAYRTNLGPQYAARSPAKGDAPTRLAAAEVTAAGRTSPAPARPERAAAPAPLPAASAPKLERVSLPAAPKPVSEPAAAPPARAVAGGAFRIQAGAFAKPENARRAVALLAKAGRATVEPVVRDGVTLYRVVLSGEGGAAAAEAMRARAAEAGFEDARIVRKS